LLALTLSDVDAPQDIHDEVHEALRVRPFVRRD